ncbi:MAG: flagellar hook-associated protein FlgK [Caldimonas manganoxidans]|uniref:flagellar hook-associated protein FlgK n=1 Tax=Caldimonas taiwanensis TaxID=307483 RepID=UPI0007867BE2|nr:flagellar hook-associated protein FlgK [Caldimonas taiwanensis]MCX7660365.1 flagellar hook-associated protein FlgK [Caldimonas manganoxidans]GIX25747.1 MAG: flagellar hook protein FlgK [Caldimonas sp.]
MSGLISLGTRTMFAAQAQLNTTANNISNANTPGYSRQTVQLETAGGQFTGAGFFGKGVKITTVERAHNAFLSAEVANTAAVAAGDATRLDYLQRMEKVFRLGESGLGFAAGQLLNAFVDVASNPSDASARQVVLSRLESLASRYRSAAGELTALQQGLTQDLKTSIATVNELTQRVADLNQQIARVKGLGHQPNDLLDQRDQLIAEISQFIQVTQIPASDGTVGLFIAGGQRLVLGNDALPLTLVPDPYDNSIGRLGLREAGVDRPLVESSLGGGTLAGMLRIQNQDLPAAINQVGRMAAVLAARLNEQQALGYDLNGNVGGPLLSTGSPRSLPHASNTGTAQVTVAITEATALEAADHELRFQGGAWQLRRLPDGAWSPYTPGTQVAGITLSVPAGTPADGDRFLIQPVRFAATDLRAALTDPNGIAAAAPVVAAVSPANQGTMGVSTLLPKQADPNLGQPLQIVFTSPTTFNIVGTVSGTPSTTLVPGEPIRINGWELSVTGVPQAGDVIEVRSTAVTAGALASNNGNALALLALRDEPMVGGETLTDAYASVLADVGIRVQGAQSSAEMSKTIAREAQVARDELSGVNLDEEAARLIQFQQAYQAAAKVLQVAQQVFDTILQTAGR